MANGEGPMTAAERQRALRERRKKAKQSNVIDLPGMGDGGGGPPEDDGEEVSLAELNARMRRMALRAFDEVGGVEYLKRVALKNHSAFLRHIGQFITRDDMPDPSQYTFIVQQINVTGGPVAGVITSPVLEHIHPDTPYLPGPGEVIDVEPPDA